MRRGQEDTLFKTHLKTPEVCFFDDFPLFLISQSFFTGGNLNAASRQALMQKLARVDSAPVREEIKFDHLYFFVVYANLFYSNRPNIPDNMTSRSVVLKNMFDPEE
jgi:hypothetical protein